MFWKTVIFAFLGKRVLKALTPNTHFYDITYLAEAGL